MKKRILNKLLIAVLIITIVSGQPSVASALATDVDLASAGYFAVLAGSAITDAAPTGAIEGNVGLSPSAGSNITGLTSAQVSGTIYAVDVTGPDAVAGNNPGLLTSAKNDLNAAYTDAEGQASDTALVANTTDSFAVTGYTLSPGVYTSTSTIGITGTLTLDGLNDPSSIFVFQAGSSLTTATDSEIVLINGASACNIFWQVGSSATLGTTSLFKGTIMAAASITDEGGSTVSGRFLADADNDGTGAVNLNNTDITVPCAPSLTLIKVVDNSDGGSSAASDWTLSATGAGGTPTNLSGNTSVVSSTIYPDGTFEADTYSLLETGNIDNYDASEWSCVKNGGAAVLGSTITLTGGEIAVCTITNTYDRPTRSGSRPRSTTTESASTGVLNVIKFVINNNLGVSTSTNFNVYISQSGFNVAGSPATGLVSPGRAYNLAAGTYMVSEDVNIGAYVRSYSGDCDMFGHVTVVAGEVKTCVVTNDDVGVRSTTPPPTLPNAGFGPVQSNSFFLTLIVAGLSGFTMYGLTFLSHKRNI